MLWLNKYGCGIFDCTHGRNHDELCYPSLISPYESSFTHVRDDNEVEESIILEGVPNNSITEIEKKFEFVNHEYVNSEKGRHAHLE